MDYKTLKSILTIGETVAVEFKRCGNGIEHDVYESVCSFLNRFGGDILMGVLDDGTVLGIQETAAPDMIRMLLGKDDVILDVVPAYVTDALLRKVNVDRYDDREIIKTNLVESYEQLMEFARKHLLPSL